MVKKVVLILLFITTVTISLVSQSCSDNPVDPYANLEPGRRDYKWSVDTLVIPFTFLGRIWGSSSQDVWAIGPGGDKDKTIYHYNGTKWENDGIARGINPRAIWGFGQDDVWIGGSGVIFHFDGENWSNKFEYFNNDFHIMGINDIWGDSPDNIWAVGFADSSNVRRGMIFHFDGAEWKRIFIKDEYSDLLRIRRGLKSSENYFILGASSNADTLRIFEFNKLELRLLKEQIFTTKHVSSLQEIDNEIYCIIDNDLYCYSDGSFNLVLKGEVGNVMAIFDGRNRKDIFWTMKGGISHYNGKNIQSLLNYENDVSIRDCVLFNDQVFFLENNFVRYENLIIIGTLLN